MTLVHEIAHYLLGFEELHAQGVLAFPQLQEGVVLALPPDDPSDKDELLVHFDEVGVGVEGLDDFYDRGDQPYVLVAFGHGAEVGVQLVLNFVCGL